MTSPIDSIVANANSQTAITTSASSVTKKDNTTLDKDSFLKLLVAQLKYQDPSKPMDSSAFMAQTAQFTQVEKLQELATNQQNVLDAQLMVGASNMIGRQVSYTGLDGKEAVGVVTSTTLGSSPTLTVGANTDVPLSSVKQVSSITTAGK
ncbi:MAG: flagellar hook capping protein [Actinomycetia bacterium]|jgi:flagellar basal-body rod modification protein FlgD|nr:flagellar hook capping protein [Actinomycetes bacterium]